jgi:prepilin-type N-terminal cleavage/methylation domain-containing protein
MKSSRTRRLSRQGFTLLELAVVVALVLILTAIGIVQSTDALPRYRTRQAAMDFVSSAQRCRALAVQLGRECSVLLREYDSDLSAIGSQAGEYWIAVGDASRNSSTWDYLPEDAEDGSDDDFSEGMFNIADPEDDAYNRYVSIADWGPIGGPGVGNSDRIVFDPRGYLSNPSSDFDGTGHIRILFVNEAARDDGRTEDYAVLISRGGMLRVDPSTDRYAGLTAGTPLSTTH